MCKRNPDEEQPGFFFLIFGFLSTVEKIIPTVNYQLLIFAVALSTVSFYAICCLSEVPAKAPSSIFSPFPVFKYRRTDLLIYTLKKIPTIVVHQTIIELFPRLCTGKFISLFIHSPCFNFSWCKDMVSIY